MPLVAAYHRPTTIDDALALLSEPTRVVLAGGTTVNADREPAAIEVVDLQALGLGGVDESDGRIRMGATTTLAELTESDLVPDLVRRLARAEAPSTLRTLATVGGTVAGADANSMLLAAFLVHDAWVELAGAESASLVDTLTTGIPPGSIITAVSLDAAGAGAQAATGRTPADVPIVAAVARLTDAGPIVALTGVGRTPMLVDGSNPTAGLDPPGDFRGSSDYRLELARILTGRAMEVLV